MRNLTLCQNEFVAATENLDCVVFEGDNVLVLGNKSAQYFSSESTRVEWNCELPEGPCRGFHFICELDSFCGFVGQSLVVISLEHEVEVVGHFPCEILAAEWSPGEDILAVLTGERKLTLMNCNWDSLGEVSLEDMETEAKGSISWRSDGEFFSLCYKMRDHFGIKVFSRDGEPHSTAHNLDNSFPENVYHCISWHPDGSLIAAWEVRPAFPPLLISFQTEGSKVIFFEHNGLRHGEFEVSSRLLADTPFQDVNVCWNASGDVLLVLLSFESASILQFWTRMNYHWYLKREIELSSNSKAWWHSEEPLLFYFRCEDELRVARFCWDVCVGGQDAECLVVDGSRLLMTTLRRQMIPPPMASAVHSLGSTIVSVCHCPDGNDSWSALLSSGEMQLRWQGVSGMVQITDRCGAAFFRQLRWCGASHDGSLLIAAIKAARGGARDSVILWTVELRDGGCRLLGTDACEVEGRIASICTVGGRTMQMVVGTFSGKLVKLSLKPDLRLLEEALPPFPVACPWMSSLESETTGQTTVCGRDLRSKLYVNGTLLAAQVGSFAVDIGRELLLYIQQAPATVLHAVSLRDCETIVDEGRPLEGGSRLVAALPDDVRVVIQLPRGNIEAISCRSLVVPAACLLVESGQYGSAVELMLKHRLDVCLLPDWNPICFLQSIPEVVDQLLKKSSRLNAFVTNLHDNSCLDKGRCAPAEWVWSASLFKPHQTRWYSWWCRKRRAAVCGAIRLFLAGVLPDLGAIDFGACMDPSCRSKTFKSLLAPLLRASEELDQTLLTGSAALLKSRATWGMSLDQIRGILSSLLYEASPKSQQALRIAQSLICSGQEAPIVSIDAAIDHIRLFVSAHKLFESALATYDLSLISHVGSRIQMDPREYVPLLREFQSMPENLKRYSIDLKLERYPSALDHIARAQIEEPDKARKEEHLAEVLRLLGGFGGYERILSLFVEHGSPERQAVLQMYGNSLLESSMPENASMVLLSASPPFLTEALAAQERILDWQGALLTAQQLGWDSEKVAALALRLARRMGSYRERKKEAAELLLAYGGEGQVSAAIGLLVECGQCQQALLVANRSGNAELAATAGCLIGTACRRLADKLQHRNRWTDAFAEFQSASVERGTVQADLSAAYPDVDGTASETASVATATTATTVLSRSSTGYRQRQRTDPRTRRLAVLNSAMQDAIIVIANRVPSSADAAIVSDMLRALCLTGKPALAQKLQKTFGSLVSSMHLLQQDAFPDLASALEQQEAIRGSLLRAEDVSWSMPWLMDVTLPAEEDLAVLEAYSSSEEESGGMGAMFGMEEEEEEY